MLTHPTIDKLHALHLTAMATAFDQQRSASQYAELGFDDRFGLLVARYQDVAFRTAFVITRDADDAADAAQQGFIKAFRGLARFRAGAPFRPWLLRIVANEAVSQGRSAGARDRLLRRVAVPSEHVESPEDLALAAERRQSLLAAIGRSRPEDRLVIAYRYFLDMSESEMAAALDCAPGTVKSRLSRALARLRAELGGRP